FAACRDHGVAVEINCRPERQDPPDRLLRLAIAAGCTFAIDSDAHAPGQLDWLDSGCTRAESLGIQPDQVINTRSADDLPGGGGSRMPRPPASANRQEPRDQPMLNACPAATGLRTAISLPGPSVISISSGFPSVGA